MATRSRTLLFLNFRNSINRGGKSRVPDIDTSEHAGLMSNVVHQGEVVVEMSLLPPKWVDVVEEIEESFNSITAKINLMDSLYKRHALPGFDDKFGEEKSIDQVTEDLTKLFQNTQRLVKNISHHGGSHQSDVLGKNIQNSLASRLQELSTKFRKSQSKYLKKLRKRETQGAATNFATNEEDADEDAVFTDAQMAVVASNENAITQREKEINEIAKSIMAVAEIFQELQTMVIDQGTVLDRIDYNIEQTNVALESAHEELLKAEKYQSNSKAKYCIVVLLFMVFIMFIVLYVKFSRRK